MSERLEDDAPRAPLCDGGAAGFAQVDAAEDPERFVAYLDAQAGTPFWRSVKADSIAALDLSPGRRVLDVGCGVGADVRAIAERVAPGGSAAGVDASEALLEVARERLAAAAQRDHAAAIELVAGRAEKLPFDDASFDAVRCERTLQHIPEVDAAVGEIVRVARPGATICLIEPDWETLVFAVDPVETSRAVAALWAARVAQPRIGRELAGRLHEHGLRGVTVCARTAVMETLVYADQQLDLLAMVESAAADGTLEPEAAEAWLADARSRADDGRFLAAATYFIVAGRVAAR